jgi:hypothetical protein
MSHPNPGYVPSEVPTNLEDLADVNVGSKAAQCVLMWDGTQWKAAPRAAAVPAPNAQTAAYVQADAQSVVTSVNAIRAALTAVGITA